MPTTESHGRFATPRHKTPTLIVLGIALSVAALLLSCLRTAHHLVWKWDERRRTALLPPIQAALEDYHLRHGAYPESLEAAAITAPETFYYQPKLHDSYILGFGLQLGEGVEVHPPHRP